MNSRKLLLGLTGLFLLATSTEVWAVRCGNRLVNTGDPISRAARFCPEPFWVEEWRAPGAGNNQYQFPPGQRTHRSSGLVTYHAAATDYFEAWYINFGSRKLMRRLVFRNGYLDYEDTLGYGFKSLPRKKCRASDLETAGRTLAEIFLKCGPPDYDYSYPVTVYPRHKDRKKGYGGRLILYRHVWTYNLKGQLDRELHCEEGRVIQLNVLRD